MSSQTPSRSDDWPSRAATCVGLLAATHLLTSFVPSLWTWGIDYWSDVSIVGRLFLTLICLLPLFDGFRARLATVVEELAARKWFMWVALAAAFALFLAYRSQGLAYGDGYSFRGYLLNGQLPEMSGNLAMMRGDLLVHWIVYRFLGMPFHWTVDTTYAVLSALAGVVSLGAIVRIARNLFPKEQAKRLFILAVGCTSGTAVLWFGHVEAYSLVNAALLWTIALFSDPHPNPRRLLVACGVWILAVFFHLLALALLPLLLFAFLRVRGQQIAAAGRRAMILFLAGFVLCGLLGVLSRSIAPDVAVPLWPTPDSNYTAVSVQHLVDALNLLAFAAPVALLYQLIRFARKRSLDTLDTAALAPLAVASASLWYFSFWVDPLIGAFRDWDLLAAFGVPMSIWGAASLVRVLPGANFASTVWLWAAMFVIAHTGGFVASVQEERQVVERVDRLVRQDVHYSSEFHRGERLMSWAHAAQLTDRYDISSYHLSKRAQFCPEDVRSWKNLGSAYWFQKKLDSAAVAFRMAVAVAPGDLGAWRQLGRVSLESGNLKATADAYSHIVELGDSIAEELNVLAGTLVELKTYAAAEVALDASQRRVSAQADVHYLRGKIAEGRGDPDAAIKYYETALTEGGASDDLYYRLAQVYQQLGRREEALRAGTDWVSRNPGSGMANLVVGMAYFSMRDYQKALESLRRTIRLVPQSALASFYLASTHRNLGQPDQAKEYALRAASIDPNLALPYLELVYLAADAGDRPAAVAATREYLKRAPQDSSMVYLQQFMEP